MPKAKKPRIPSLVKAAEAYKANLLNRNVLLVGIDRDGNVGVQQFRFLARHFRHLTGVRTTQNIKAVDFFNRCVEHRIADSDIREDPSGFAELKLQASKAMFKPDLSATFFGDANGSRLYVQADKYAGNNWACLGFVEDSGWHDPMTMLDSPVEKEISQARKFRVVAVFAKAVTESRYGAPIKVALRERDSWDKIQSMLPAGYSYLSL